MSKVTTKDLPEGCVFVVMSNNFRPPVKYAGDSYEKALSAGKKYAIIIGVYLDGEFLGEIEPRKEVWLKWSSNHPHWRPKDPDEEKIIAYKLTYEHSPGWLCLGKTPKEVGFAIQEEIFGHEGLSAEERGVMQIEAYETTQEEIDNLKEFQGW